MSMLGVNDGVIEKKEQDIKMTNEKGIMNIQREIKIKHREKTIEIHSMNKLKKVKVYELKLKRLRLRAQNKCYLDIANKIKRGMTLEQLNQYCFGSQIRNLDLIDEIKFIIKDISLCKFSTFEMLKNEVLKIERKYNHEKN
jgi:hypothetical protein